MLNPTFFQVDTQDGEMRLETARLDRVDPRILDDIGLTDAEWASATGSSSARVLLAAFLEKVRQVFVRRRLTERRPLSLLPPHERTFCFRPNPARPRFLAVEPKPKAAMGLWCSPCAPDR